MGDWEKQHAMFYEAFPIGRKVNGQWKVDRVKFEEMTSGELLSIIDRLLILLSTRELPSGYRPVRVYKVERTDEVGYDEFDSMIVVAESEEDAITMHPSGEWSCTNWVKYGERDTLKVERIDERVNKRGVILASR